MSTVCSFADYRYRAELAVLRHLIRRVQRGEIHGLALCVKGDHHQEEDPIVLGTYLDNPSTGLAAAVRLSLRLNALCDGAAG